MVSGTGHAGMEACIANLVEPGDKVVVGNAGIWGDRVAEMARRFRGEIAGQQGGGASPPQSSRGQTSKVAWETGEMSPPPGWATGRSPEYRYYSGRSSSTCLFFDPFWPSMPAVPLNLVQRM